MAREPTAGAMRAADAVLEEASDLLCCRDAEAAHVGLSHAKVAHIIDAETGLADLVEACEGLMADWDGYGEATRGGIERLRSALVKAKGNVR